NDEIAEALILLALLRIADEDRLQQPHDLRLADILRVELVEPRAVERSPEIKIVEAGVAPHEADLGEIRPRASVRAPGHADDDVIFLETRFLDELLERGHETRQEALAFGERKSARRQRNACHAVATERGRGERAHAVPLQDGIDLRLGLRTDVGDDD